MDIGQYLSRDLKVPVRLGTIPLVNGQWQIQGKEKRIWKAQDCMYYRSI